MQHSKDAHSHGVCFRVVDDDHVEHDRATHAFRNKRQLMKNGATNDSSWKTAYSTSSSKKKTTRKKNASTRSGSVATANTKSSTNVDLDYSCHSLVQGN